MSFRVPISILKEVSSDQFRHLSGRDISPTDLTRDTEVNLDRMSATEVQEIRQIAMDKGARKFIRALDAVIAQREGVSDWKVPNFGAFESLLRGYLTENFRDGWIYERCEDGQILPWAISRIHTTSSGWQEKAPPRVILSGSAWGSDGKRLCRIAKTWSFEPGDVSRRHIGKVIETAGLLAETDLLRDAHDEADATLTDVLNSGFAKQFRVTGPVFRYSRRDMRDLLEPVGRRVIMDIDESRVGPMSDEIETGAFSRSGDSRFIEEPRHPVVDVFDLQTHESYWINVAHIELYKYKPELRDSLILPDEQRDLLDILTKDIGLLTGDIIEGKSAGNIIMAKGVPGTGKTLTAEIYSEVIGKPLYSVHAGVLGTTAEKIANNLRDVFQRAQRWDCILLLDEADVFVMTRGMNVEQNAIVAEFLRTLEHYAGLMFMTTNRPDDIDDAILSRCAAIIHYEPPSPALAERVWRVMSNNFHAEVPEALIGDLVRALPGISARDIKMLMRLTLRVSGADGRTPDLEDFRRCAMFRGINARENQASRKDAA